MKNNKHQHPLYRTLLSCATVGRCQTNKALIRLGELLRVLRPTWAFDAGINSVAKLPLDANDYHGFVPGNPGEQVPVTLTVTSEERRRLIDEVWAKSESEKASLH
jgi:hypothetical protein